MVRSSIASVSCLSPPHSSFRNLPTFCCISLINPNYYGKKFASVVKFMQDNFSNHVFVVSGYLYRHYYKLLGNVSNPLEFAEEKENEYIRLELNGLPYVRWKDLYNEEKFGEIERLFLVNDDFRESVLESAMSFLDKHGMNGIELSIRFILEEISVICLLMERGYEVEVYAGNHLDVLRKISCGEITADIPLPLSKRISIELKIRQKGHHRKKKKQ